MTFEQAKSILEITGEFNKHSLKKKYRQKAKILHPDRNNNPTARLAFIELKAAYDYLLIHPVPTKPIPHVVFPTEKKVRKARASHQRNKRKQDELKAKKIAFESYISFLSSRSYRWFKVQAIISCLLALVYLLDTSLPVNQIKENINTFNFDLPKASAGGLSIQQVDYHSISFYIPSSVFKNKVVEIHRSAIFNDLIAVKFNDTYVKPVYVASRNLLPLLIIGLLIPLAGLLLKGPTIYFLMAVRWGQIFVPVIILFTLFEQARLFR